MTLDYEQGYIELSNGVGIFNKGKVIKQDIFPSLPDDIVIESVSLGSSAYYSARIYLSTPEKERCKFISISARPNQLEGYDLVIGYFDTPYHTLHPYYFKIYKHGEKIPKKYQIYMEDLIKAYHHYKEIYGN